MREAAEECAALEEAMAQGRMEGAAKVAAALRAHEAARADAEAEKLALERSLHEMSGVLVSLLSYAVDFKRRIAVRGGELWSNFTR